MNIQTMNTKTQKILLWLISGLSILLLFLYFHTVTPFSYETNDDVYLRMLSSGEFTGSPTAHLWYVGYPVGLLLAGLYRLIPSIPWYGLFLCFVIWLSIVTVLHKVLTLCHTIYGKVLAILFALLTSYGFFLLHVAELQFTVVTGFAGGAALFLFCMSEAADTFRKTLRGYAGFFCMATLSVCIRDKGFFMLLPILGLMGIGKLIDASKKQRIALLKTGCLFGALLLLVLGIHNIANSSDGWKSFGRYTKAHEIIYDYAGYPDYDAHQDIYEELGITRSSYESAKHYNIMLNPAINEDSLTVLAELAESEQPVTLQTLPAKLSDLAGTFLERHLSYLDRPLNLLVYGLYFGIALLALCSKRLIILRDLLFLFAGRMFIWFYLLYNGRLPGRVSQAEYLAELAVLLAIACRHRIWDSEKTTSIAARLTKACWCLTLILMVLLSVRFGFAKGKAVADEVAGRLRFAQSFTDIKEYFAEHPDNYYYLDMLSFSNFTENALSGGSKNNIRVTSDGIAKPASNFIQIGGWLPCSPWYTDRLAAEGIDDPVSAFYENPNVYAVFMKTEATGFDYLADYYMENYHVSIEVVEEVPVSNDITFQILKAYKE